MADRPRAKITLQELYQDEIDSAFLYQTLAELEENPLIAEVYHRLAAEENRHAALWRARLEAEGLPVPPPRPSRRARILAWLARRFGAQFVLPTLVEQEQADAARYTGVQGKGQKALVGDEHGHAQILRALRSVGRRGVPGGILAQMEGRHSSVGGNALRAAVLGANDGLVSNLSLVMGVAGAATPNKGILIAGMAGLLAGAISMALGEWLSVTSSRELYERQIEIEAEELELMPKEEEEELVLIYMAKGLPEDQARELAHRLSADRAMALDTLAREELGIDPEELGGSAWEAAFASFFLFAVGAIIPVLPFFFLQGLTAVILSLIVSALGMFAIGAAITLVTGRSVLYSGLRQMFVGLAAAAVTYGIGWLLGVSIAG